MHSEKSQKYQYEMMFMYHIYTCNLIIKYETATFECVTNICNDGPQCLRCLNVHGKLSEREHSSIKKIVMFPTSTVICYMQHFT